MLKPMDICPSCGGELAGRALPQALPARPGRLPMRELRRCGSCRRLAWRPEGSSQPWEDGGLDPSRDYLSGWEPKPLPESWILVPEPQARADLEAQLRAEVTEGHPLFDKPVIAVARCGQCDEVLFSIDEDPVRFVRVHLTWRQGPDRPPWPATQYLSLPLSNSLAGHAH